MGVAQDFLADLLNGPRIEACIRWPYATNSSGHPHMFIDGKTVTLARHVCEAVYGPPPPGARDASHNCGIRRCINPGHLSWKPHRDVCLDKVIHGQSNRGERCGSSKLTREQVAEIRRLSAVPTRRGEGRHKKLAERFGVSSRHIHQVANGKKWPWLEVEG